MTYATTTAEAEPLLPVSTFISQLPGSRAGKPVHPSTIGRWISRGITTPSGRVRLRAVRVGARWLVRQSWFDEFVSALTSANLPPADAPVPPRTPNARRAASDRAAAELESLGI